MALVQTPTTGGIHKQKSKPTKKKAKQTQYSPDELERALTPLIIEFVPSCILTDAFQQLNDALKQEIFPAAGCLGATQRARHLCSTFVAREPRLLGWLLDTLLLRPDECCHVSGATIKFVQTRVVKTALAHYSELFRKQVGSEMTDASLKSKLTQALQPAFDAIFRLAVDALGRENPDAILTTHAGNHRIGSDEHSRGAGIVTNEYGKPLVIEAVKQLRSVVRAQLEASG